MKFKNINVHNVGELVPSWAIDPIFLARHLDELFDHPDGREIFSTNKNVGQRLRYWIEVDALLGSPSVRVCTPDEHADNCGILIIKSLGKLAGNTQIEVPLNSMLKGYPNVQGQHVLYCHSFQTEVPLAYVGISKRRWFERLSQHITSAKSGSPYLFHRAIVEHQEKTMMHKVFLCGISSETAMKYEEEFVGSLSLYPLGLNMIPGGKAGMAYLHKLGVAARSLEERDEALERLSSQEQLAGRPNPLCAARWAEDQSFVERVICGHSGRLTAEQVRTIRLLAGFGKSESEITHMVSASNDRQVANVLKSKTYGRIK